MRLRNWGIAITIFYALALVFLLMPACWYLLLDQSNIEKLYQEWAFWVWPAILIGGEAILLFISVDTSRKRLKPRRHILISISTTALFFHF